MRSLIVGFISLLAVARSGAQGPLPGVQYGEQYDLGIQMLLRTATENIHQAICNGSNRCEPATSEEIANPPLTLVEAKQIADRAYLSGAAVHCGLDWEGRNFMPMIAYWRKVGKTDRQIALIGLLHGYVQSFAMAPEKKSCSDRTRQDVEARLDFIVR